MVKKCLPGVICIENLTMVLLLIIIAILMYIVYIWQKPVQTSNIIVEKRPILAPVVQPSLNNPYIPPLKVDNIDYGLPLRIPVNIETRGLNQGYTQVGILTNNGNILPLMGRRLMTGRDKWQYYTVTTTGNMNTKLPIRVNGKNAMSEYGCDEIYDGDTVFVEGYKETYLATIYENAAFRYI
jgi:hypothetical protein